MSMHPPGRPGGGGGGGVVGRGGRVSSGDIALQKKLNAEAPKIPHLLGRIAELFRPHRFALGLTVSLVLAAAALSVAPPLLTQRIFDEGLFPPGGGVDVPRLAELVGLMVAAYVVSALLGVWQTYLTATVGNAVMGALRVRLFSELQSMDM